MEVRLGATALTRTPREPYSSANERVKFVMSSHVQLVVTDNQPNSEKTQWEVAGERHWLLNDLSAKHDFLRAGLGWGHMPADRAADDLVTGGSDQNRAPSMACASANLHGFTASRTRTLHLRETAN